MGAVKYRSQIYPPQVGGFVLVCPSRDRVDGSERFLVVHQHPNGGRWQSSPIELQDHADAAARLLGEFTSALVR